MSRISLAAAIGISTLGGLLLSSLVEAAEIKVLASVALTSALNELAPQYERTTGNKLSLGYSLVADIRKRVLEGETADVIILSRPEGKRFAGGTITLSITQIQYSQEVILNFDGMRWPHVSVASLVPAAPIPLPAPLLPLTSIARIT